MTAAEKIRALMADGRTRTPEEIVRALRLPQPTAWSSIRSMANPKSKRTPEPFLVRFLPPPESHLEHPDWTRQHDHGRGYLYRINPNHRDAIAMTA